MSTPRTDKQQATGNIGIHPYARVPASFARELEIETQQLQAERDALSRALRMVHEEMGHRISAAAFAEFSEEAKEMILEALALSQPKP